jgi:antitoxin component HigA of HigAB toxin-antitoxin module
MSSNAHLFCFNIALNDLQILIGQQIQISNILKKNSDE